MRRTRRSNRDFDPAGLNDAIANQTNWRPAKVASASFCTHRLVAVHSERREFYATVGAQLFYGLFFAIGLLMLLGFASFSVFSFSADFLIPLFVGLTFTLAGAGMFYWGSTPIVFDYASGFFWKGRQAPTAFAEQNIAKQFARLDRIHALQLLSKYNRSNKHSYWSYQLNLVLQDGQRINVLNHGNKQRLQSDAAELAAFLGKTVWDAI